MSTESMIQQIETRLTQLEKQVAQMSGTLRHEPGRDDWKNSIGMFRGDPIAAEVIQESLRLREEERGRARNGVML